jgi:hypothetical protein
MEYQYNDGLEFDPHADSDHDWVDLGNTKNISPDRPPVLNLDNFSSAEAGTPANDPHTDAHYVLSMNMNKLLAEHAPSSYPSSNDGSLRAPDGPERRDPANQFLPVAPATGLGEVQHRRRASFDVVEDQISHGIRKYLEALPPHERSFHASWEAPQGSWLPLATYIVGPTDSVRATRGKSSGSASALPGSVYSGASSGWKSSSIDPVFGSGDWIVESALGEWPREIDEEDIEEDGD